MLDFCDEGLKRVGREMSNQTNYLDKEMARLGNKMDNNTDFVSTYLKKVSHFCPLFIYTLF